LPDLTLPGEYKHFLGQLPKKRSPRLSKGKDNPTSTQGQSSLRGYPSVTAESCYSKITQTTACDKCEDWQDALISILKKTHPLGRDEWDDAAMARQLDRVIDTWNALPTHLNATWELFQVFRRHSATRHNVEWLPDEKLAEMDTLHQVGNVTTNERSYNCTISEQSLIKRFWSYLNPREALSEGEAEDSGTYLQKIISGDGITDKRLVPRVDPFNEYLHYDKGIANSDFQRLFDH
jgi:hypothetical protein